MNIDNRLFSIYYESETGNIVAQQFCTNRRKVLMDNVSPHMVDKLFHDPYMRENNGWEEIDFESGCIGE